MKSLLTILALLLALACFWAAGNMNGELLELRRAYRLDQADPLVNAPPLVVFTTVALGGFRGVLADILWVRAQRLQEEGRYFELVQLADWITKLEPRFSQGWAYNAWNLAYNISVMFNDPEDRWRWVRHGIELLRDSGLRYNPGDPRLYRELGWLFQHKIGGAYDQAHVYYLRAWAGEMMELFDGRGPDYEALAAAPTNSPLFARRRRMIREYKLDPTLMAEVDGAYGPFDWRLPQAHAVYWARQGRKVASGFEAVACDRMIYQSMGDAFREGLLFVDTNENVFALSPNLDLLPRVVKAYEDAIAEHPDQETYREAYANFLRETIVILYTYHHNAEARELFGTLRELAPKEETEGGFESFIYRAFAAGVSDLSSRDALAIVEGAAFQSYLWHALGDEERSAGYDQLAQLCWREYMTSLRSPEAVERVGLPPLDQLRRQALEKAREALRSEAARARLDET